MSNFARVIRLTLRHRLTVVASILCSLGVALLWGGSIMAIVPIVDGVMHGKSIPALLEEKIGSTEARIAELDAELSRCRQELADSPAGQDPTLRAELRGLTELRSSKSAWLGIYQRSLPTARKWLPSTPFGTLVAICLALLTSTALKSVLRIAGTFFMARLGHLTGFELRKQFYRHTLRLDLGTFQERRRQAI